MLKLHKPITVQTILIAIALVAGICIRLIQLSQIPLGDHEATLALQAYRFSAGLPTTLDGEPFYLLLTIALFSMFGSSVFLARLVPALMGILLVASPLLIRKYLKPLELVLVVWFLALEPSLVVASRSVTSAIITLSLSVMLFAAYTHHKKKTAGVLLALLILSGTGFWWMAVLAAISLLIWTVALRRSMDWQNLSGFLKEKAVWVTCLLTLAVGGSFFFLIPSGFNTISNAIPAFLQEVSIDSGMRWWLPPLALLIYSSLVVVFGIWGSIRSWLDLDQRHFLVLLALVGLRHAPSVSGA